MAVDVFLVDDVATEVAQWRLQHIEDEVRLQVFARAVCLRVGDGTWHLLGLRLAEVLDHLGGRTEKRHLATAVEQQGFVEVVEKARARLVDADEADLVL